MFHEATYFIGAFVLVTAPASATGIYFVDSKQIEHTPCLLCTGQDEALCARIPPSPIRFDSNGLPIEEQEHTSGW